MNQHSQRRISRTVLSIAAWGLLVWGQPGDILHAQDNANAFDQARATAEQQLDQSTTELSRLRQNIVEEKVPLVQQLNELEDQLIQVRREYQQTVRLLDTRTLDLSNLRTEIKSRQDEKTYLSNLLSEYMRNFETCLHIAELQRYKEPLEAAELAVESSDMNETEVYETQASLVTASLERLHYALGGTRFDGKAVDASGLVKSGTFVLIGPAALFRSDDGRIVGTVEQRLGSLEPTVFGFESETAAEAAANAVASSSGRIPFDPTLGSAHKIEATKESILEHIKKGGAVMIPILALAGAALLVALLKWLELMRLRNPSDKRVETLLEAVARHDEDLGEKAKAVGGPTGAMLQVGVEHIKEPRELVEEIMYEKILTARLRLQRWLPFVAISASSAPLLGLLGTVTGIINTFKLITVFGSGDVKTLSGGISEALITTEFGLIVAIPSLLLHAFLSRKARGIIDRMEKAAIAFINQITKTPYHKEETADVLAKMPAAQVQALLQNLARQDNNGQKIHELVPYAEGSAGAMMRTDVVCVNKNHTVAEAISKIRAAEIDADFTRVFVVDDQGRYLGDVHLRQLLTRAEQVRIEALVEADRPFIRVDADQQDVERLLRKYDLPALPVLDPDDRLVGCVTAEQAMVPAHFQQKKKYG